MSDDARQEPVAATGSRRGLCRNCHPHPFHGFRKCPSCDCVGTFRGEPVAIEKPFSNWLFRHAVAREGDWFVCQSCGARASDPNGMSHTAVPVSAAEVPKITDEQIAWAGMFAEVLSAEDAAAKMKERQLKPNAKYATALRALFALTPPENTK